MDQVHRIAHLRTQLRSKPLFEVKGHQIPFIHAGLVGAVGIENTTERNFKELEEMQGSAKELKRNNRECKGILIGPLMAPRFFDHRDSVTAYFTHCPSRAVGFGLKF
jgi:hypothetical protein